MCARMKGPSTKMPQRPMTTLGTAASIWISEPITPRIERRGELAEEEADRDRQRRGEQERAERGHERADDELARAEDLGDRVPVAVPDERDARTPRSPASAPSMSFQTIPAMMSTARSAARAVSRAAARCRRSGRARAASGACRPWAQQTLMRTRLPRGQLSMPSAGAREGLSPLRHRTFTSCAPSAKTRAATLVRVNVVEPPHSGRPCRRRRPNAPWYSRSD